MKPIFLLALAAMAMPAQAATISGLYNTGVADDGTGATPLADGSVDSHYLLNGVANAAIVYSNGSYTTPGDAAYISAASGGGFVQNPNFYSLVFDLTGFDASTARITGRFAADDEVEIFLNGTDTGIGVTGFYSLTEFAVVGGFAAGTNTLTFRVKDTQGTPSAFVVDRIEGSVEPAVAAVPEPATWAMMIFGFGLVGRSMRRRGVAGGAVLA